MKKSGSLIVVLMLTTFFGGFYISELHDENNELRETVVHQQDSLMRLKVEALNLKAQMLELDRQLGICKTNANLLTEELLNLEDEIKKLEQVNKEQKNELEKKEGRITAIMDELNTISALKSQLKSQLEVVRNQYATLSQEHENCQAETDIFHASILPKFPKKEIPSGQTTKVQLPVNFGKITLHVLLIIIFITILTAAVQGLIKSLRHKSRTLVD